jgi:hypothetical protein
MRRLRYGRIPWILRLLGPLWALGHARMAQEVESGLPHALTHPKAPHDPSIPRLPVRDPLQIKPAVTEEVPVRAFGRAATSPPSLSVQVKVVEHHRSPADAPITCYAVSLGAEPSIPLDGPDLGPQFRRRGDYPVGG